MKIKYGFIELNTSDFEGDGDVVRLKSNYRTAIAKAHDQNSDTKLANGTADEVTAAALRAFLDSKGQNSGLASLNSSGKIPDSQIPSISIIDVHPVADITERDALTVQKGDVAVVDDSGDGSPKSYIYNGTIWKELKTPNGAVSSVNGLTGTVVLDAGDIAIATPSGWTAADVQAFVDEVSGAVDTLEAFNDSLGGTGGADMVGFDNTGCVVLTSEATLQDAVFRLDSLVGAAQDDIVDLDTRIDSVESRAEVVPVDPITVDSTILSAKKVTLPANPGNAGKMFVFLESVLQLPTTDYVITNSNELNWDAKGMQNIVAEGHTIRVFFFK